MLLRRAVDLRGALKLGVRIGLEEIRADELSAMMLLDEECGKHNLEKMQARTP